MRGARGRARAVFGRVVRFTVAQIEDLRAKAAETSTHFEGVGDGSRVAEVVQAVVRMWEQAARRVERGK